jgi:hypothetical protein
VEHVQLSHGVHRALYRKSLESAIYNMEPAASHHRVAFTLDGSKDKYVTDTTIAQ